MTNRLLPPNATPFELALEQATGNRIDALPAPLRDVWNPDTCPPNMLPWLAWAFGVESWSAGWTVEERRAAIKSAVEVKKLKGTPAAVRRAVAALFPSASVTEQSGSYTFGIQLDVTDIALPQRLLHDVIRVAESAKNLRSHLTKVGVVATSTSELHVAAAACLGVELTVYPSNRVLGPLILDGSWALDGSQQLDGTLNG
ncbi:phage tail protein I [Aquabacterium sp.]|uniref:phage tail protein I n=1 Tax=Aquabacterium sp. TaxID=1872578 RepID=UPI003BB0DB43